MRIRCLMALASFSAGILPYVLTGAQLAASADCTYPLDTVGDWPRVLKTPADVAALRFAIYKAGDTLTTTSPDGAVLVSSKTSDAKEALPLTGGGLWTFANDKQNGEVSFTVRYSIYGNQGEGTETSPAKLVDSEELADLVDVGIAGDGYVFSWNGAGSLLAVMVLPAGFCLEQRADGTWRIVTSENGGLFTCAEISYQLDSKKDGPNRNLKIHDSRHVAYSGDYWRRDMSKSAILEFIPPDGKAPTVFDLCGTGATENSFTFDQTGAWKVRLTMADGTVREAIIRVKKGLVLSIH